VTAVDWIIVAFVLLVAVNGALQGFIATALALVGFVVGVLVGTRVAPHLLSDGSASPWLPAVAIALGILFSGIAAGAGGWVRELIAIGPLGSVDALLGALLGAALALGLAWLAGAVMLQTPGARELRRDIQRSEILSRLNETLPPSGPVLNALARFDPFPSISGPEADVPPPRARIARDPDVRAARDGTVRVTGTACGLGIEGSGWIAGPGTIVTNAHVVAGERDTEVQLRGEGPLISARVVHFDPRNDVAVLRAALPAGARTLRLDPSPERGEEGAILGFPGNGPFDVRAARLADTRTVLTDDAYGRGPVRRKIVAFRGLVRHGNSGGPIVNSRGEVDTTVFASATSGPDAGYGVPNDVVRRALDDGAAGHSASTGPCAG
jgi:S1-C subfamily serine protease